MDGTDKNQDGGEQTSGDNKGTSEKTYTETEVAEIKRKADSDAKADTERARLSAEKAVKTANDAISRLKKLEDRAYETAKEEAKDKPDVLSVLDARRRESDTQAKLDEAEAKLSEEKELRETAEGKANEATKERNAREIADKLGVSPTLLAKLSRLTDGSVEAIEAEAKMLPKTGEPRDVILVDSNKSVGGGGRFTAKDIADYSTEGKTTQEIMEDAKKVAEEFTKRR